ncbi:ribosome-binding protein 1 isoform X2 [Bombyx mori]|uniref:Ribosome-binding protein 1 n=1 Tax=Bombyx mori TaxID=7091 RepID=A0A8R2DL96_BOMMO|nr:ribosome-binding protein 1 isoform X1 [Bombyx mori]XP_021202562.2 ribosome-binding protein 1 isoform X1 [Bombyx mori]XP_021202563.2 ribosome-binding protein 1 isoform X1 [Bombyx mori]
MELQALLVLGGLGVAGIAVLLLMGLFSASGTSYEEAIAQQRKAATELLALAENKSKSKKNVKKKDKKLAKKEKSKENSGTTGSEIDSEAPAESGLEDDPTPPTKGHVEFSPPVVVDVPRDAPPNVKIRKRGKDPKVKPILLNKEDPSCVSDPSTVPVAANTTVANHFEEMHPKDEIELMQSALSTEKVVEKVEEPVDKKEAKPTKPQKTGKGAPKATSSPELKEETKEKNNTGDAPKEQRKGKKEKKPHDEAAEVAQQEIVPPLNIPQPTELTTEKLLKQALVVAPPAPSPPAGKGKKKKQEPNVLTLMVGDHGGVNVGELVRVVREASLSRTEIQILTDALLDKHHDPLPEHSEWSEGPNDPVQKLKKQLADKEKALADEVEASQALQAKLKELRTSLNAERSRASGAVRTLEAERARHEQAAAAARVDLHTHQARLQRLLDDNHQLAQEKLHLQSQLNAEAEVQAQRVQMEVHIKRLTESEAALVQQLAGLQSEAAAHAHDARQARLELGAARDALLMAQQHAAELAQQLQDANRAYTELEQHSQQERRQLQERLAELQNEVQRLANHAQTVEANTEKLKQESEKQKQQLSNEIKIIGEQLSAREAELAELKQIKAVPAQNGLTADDNEQKISKSEFAKVESVVAALRSELESAQGSSREQRDQLERLRDELHRHKHKNDELRTKNWKVMEALQSAEKALQSRTASALPAQDSLREAVAKAQETQLAEVAAVLRAACPAAAPHDPCADLAWLRTFADNLGQLLLQQKDLLLKETEKQATVVTAPPSDDRLKELADQNEHLQSLVDKYKTIIDDTEGVLSRLQQNVTTEEQRWAQQLADKQRELDELRQRTVSQMQNKIDSLQEELAQAKSARHNHTFADAERLAEERLMAGLSDKHTDISNGPLQLGLENK